jgi:hypothetical protein
MIRDVGHDGGVGANLGAVTDLHGPNDFGACPDGHIVTDDGLGVVLKAPVA